MSGAESSEGSEKKLKFDLRGNPPKEPCTQSSTLRDVITTTIETLSGKSEEARVQRERLAQEYHFNHGNLKQLIGPKNL